MKMSHSSPKSWVNQLINPNQKKIIFWTNFVMISIIITYMLLFIILFYKYYISEPFYIMDLKNKVTIPVLHYHSIDLKHVTRHPCKNLEVVMQKSWWVQSFSLDRDKPILTIQPGLDESNGISTKSFLASEWAT